MPRARRKDRPLRFKGATVVLSVSDRLGYKRGEVIDYVMNDRDVGDLVWDDLRFHVVFIPDITVAEMETLLEPLRGLGRSKLAERRKHGFNLDNVELDGKTFWDRTKISLAMTIKPDVDNTQPEEIEIP